MDVMTKHKAVLSRTVVHRGEVIQLSVVKRNDISDCQSKYTVTPFNMETESTIMVDYPIALLNREMIEQFKQSDDIDTLIKKARQLSSTITDPDSIFLLSTGKISILDI